MTPQWLIVRTEPRRELAVYSAVIEIADDAWLPREPRFSHAQAPYQRQWWVPVLPTCFLARIDPGRTNLLADIRYIVGIVRDYIGKPIIVPEDVVSSFRARLDWENRETMRLANGWVPKRERNNSRKRRPSRRKRSKIGKQIRTRILQACASENPMAYTAPHNDGLTVQPISQPVA